MMTSGKLRGGELNDLLDAAFSGLEALGNDSYAALLQDRMSARDFIGFLRRTAAQHPVVYRHVLRGVGAKRLLSWGGRLASHRFRDRA